MSHEQVLQLHNTTDASRWDGQTDISGWLSILWLQTVTADRRLVWQATVQVSNAIQTETNMCCSSRCNSLNTFLCIVTDSISGWCVIPGLGDNVIPFHYRDVKVTLGDCGTSDGPSAWIRSGRLPVDSSCRGNYWGVGGALEPAYGLFSTLLKHTHKNVREKTGPPPLGLVPLTTAPALSVQQLNPESLSSKFTDFFIVRKGPKKWQQSNTDNRSKFQRAES